MIGMGLENEQADSNRRKPRLKTGARQRMISEFMAPEPEIHFHLLN